MHSLLSRASLRLHGFGLASVLLLSFSVAGPLPAQAPQAPQEVYGPWSAVILTDGPALMEPAPGEWGARSKMMPLPESILAGNARWSLAFWFNPADPANPNGLTLLAGIGDPNAKDARFVAFVDGRMGLWLGRGQERFVAAGAGVSEGWHFAVAAGDGSTVTLYADGKAVASSAYSQGNVAAQLLMGPTAGDHHFGGKIAYLKIYDQVLTAAQIAQMAAGTPNFDVPQYTEATAHWPVQTRGMAGQTEPQDPMTLPRSKAAPQKPVAKALSPAERHTELVGKNPWTILGGWKLAAAPDVKSAGAEISKAGFAAKDWMAATVPGTVLTTMIDRGIYPDPDYGLNNLAIPETLARQDYWYRVEFASPETAGRRMTLTFNGINYAAEVWLNGQKLGGVTGAFIRGSFDVSDELVKSGMNALAVKVSPPPHPGLAQEESIKAGPGDNGGIQMLDGPTFLATEGWDWIPTIRDRNTGIWQDVTLTAEGPVSVGDVNVITTLPKGDSSEADIEIEAPLVDTRRQRRGGRSHGEL